MPTRIRIRPIQTIEINVPSASDPFELGQINGKRVFRVAADTFVKPAGPIGPLTSEQRKAFTKREQDLYFFACDMAGGTEIMRAAAKPVWYARWKICERVPQWIMKPLMRLTPGTTTYYVMPYTTKGPMGSSIERSIAKTTAAYDSTGPIQPTVRQARAYGNTYENGKIVQSRTAAVSALTLIA